MISDPSFPPLFSGLSTEEDPFEYAQSHARNGCDGGVVAYSLLPHTLRAAIVFTPEVDLGEACIMLPICGVGLQNALGALAPPEVAVHLDWDGEIRVNAGRCGNLSLAASTRDPMEVPDWLVVGLSLSLWPASDNPGETPDETALYSEGCSDVDAVALLEAWVRHTLVWINRWSEEGPKPVHSEWRGLAHGLDTDRKQGQHHGTFVGVDEDFGMLLKDDETTHLIPLTTLLSGTTA